MSAAEACSDVNTATAIGPRHFAPADTATPAVAGLPSPIAEDAPSIISNRELTLPRYDLGPAFCDAPFLQTAPAVVAERLDVLASFDLRTFSTASTTVREQPDIRSPTFSNTPSAHVSEWVRGVQALRPNGSDDLPPSRLILGDAPPDDPPCSKLTGDDRELGTPNSCGRVGQSSATTINIALSPMPPRVLTPVAGSTPLDCPSPAEELTHGVPLTSTSSEADISDYLLFASESLPDATCAAQAGGPTESYPHSVSQTTPQTDERSIPPTIGEPITPTVEDPALSSAEESIPLLAEDSITSIDGVPNPVTAEEPAVSAAEESVVPPIEESIPPAVEKSTPLPAEDPIAPTDEVSNPVPVEEPVASPIGEPILPAAEECISLLTEGPIAPADVVSNPHPVEEPTASVAGEPVAPLVEESIPLAAEGPVIPGGELSNSSATEKPNPPASEESITSQLASTPTQGLHPPPHLHTVDTVMDGTTNNPDTSETSGAFKETTSSTYQEQDEEDELIVDAILAVPPDLSTTSHPHCDTTEPNNPFAQEKDGNSVHIPAPEEVVTASPTSIELGSTPDPSSSAVDTPPLAARRSRSHPTPSRETITPAPPRCSQDTDEVTARVPLSVEPMAQESTTQHPDSRPVLETRPPYGGTDFAGWVHMDFDSVYITESLICLGALRDSRVAEKSLQHAFVTPRNPPSSSFTDGDFDAMPSSPIADGGGYWDLNVGLSQDESETDFVRACIAGPSSPTDSQGSEELSQSPDRHRRGSIQQGIGTLFVSFVYASYNPQRTADLYESRRDEPIDAPVPEVNPYPSGTQSSIPSWQVPGEESSRITHLDTTLSGLPGDGRSAGYWGGDSRPTIIDQPSGFVSTPTPGPPFQFHRGELGSNQFAQPADVPGDLTIDLCFVP
jgi:hypothetical protein